MGRRQTAPLANDGGGVGDDAEDGDLMRYEPTPSVDVTIQSFVRQPVADALIEAAIAADASAGRLKRNRTMRLLFERQAAELRALADKIVP